MHAIGIDIGSTAAKVAVMAGQTLTDHFVIPTGWSSAETASAILSKLASSGINENNSKIIATGYGRVAVPYAHKTITEITCHGRGATFFTDQNCTVVDIGGQDTKVISMENGRVVNFTMNDKCSAGTGKFIEVMANTLGVSIDNLTELAASGSGINITSMCTVFAESEVTSLIGRGEKKENIAYGIVDSVINKVKSLCIKHGRDHHYLLTGGLSSNQYILRSLENSLQATVISSSLGRYAGAIGAAMLAQERIC
ncbi:acyl-CoA dehydratase activase [Endozoicomonas gorgoniicola]|uniref:Acyl-CoA dehydratase activase n=1 Tax=Endozoicomonas gorgoniicola TaxID=1234144 RepID=A0ABT3N2K9_9GAMM|nr:acyl-CoA dehydratase activase [Endozoicomonas gorgoniicola]MCW7555870.1 acyl-CoA dehydratase activase [Endozoicomonas gorgoniicola]